MQIRQLNNKKIQFWEAGYIQFSCMPGQNYKVINKEEIHLLNVAQRTFSLFAKDIDFVSKLGGVLTSVSFSNSQELAQYLDQHFFFESDETRGNIINSYGDTLEYNQSHSAIKAPFVTSTALVAGTQYSIPIFLSGTYIEFALIQISLLAGVNFNFAIYRGDPNNGYLASEKLYQSAEFVSTGSRALFQDFPPQPISFEPGWYYFSYIASGGLTFIGTRIANTFLGFSATAAPSIVAITRYFTTGVYNNSLPNTYPTFAKDLSNPSNPILFFKKSA